METHMRVPKDSSVADEASAAEFLQDELKEMILGYAKGLHQLRWLIPSMDVNEDTILLYAIERTVDSNVSPDLRCTFLVEAQYLGIHSSPPGLNIPVIVVVLTLTDGRERVLIRYEAWSDGRDVVMEIEPDIDMVAMLRVSEWNPGQIALLDEILDTEISIRNDNDNDGVKTELCRIYGGEHASQIVYLAERVDELMTQVVERDGKVLELLDECDKTASLVSRCSESIRDAIDVIRETKGVAKIKQLGDVRERLEKTLRVVPRSLMGDGSRSLDELTNFEILHF